MENKNPGRNGATHPPSFADARNRRQKARAAGLHPDYWYAVAQERSLAPGQVMEVKFWKRGIALWRGLDGALHAVEDRCAHRQLKLSLGKVGDKGLTCAYHGWCHDGGGRVCHIPHELFGREMPSFRVGNYPVRVRYGLIWIFPGDPQKADSVPLPEITELEGPDRWACVPIEFTWNAHHTMIVENVCDFTHAYLHRRYQPFTDAHLTRCETVGDKVYVDYDTKVGMGRITKYFVDRKHVDTNSMALCYDYPYQWSNTDGKIKHWCFVLPIDERTTKAFFLFYFDSLKVPLLPLRLPRRVMSLSLTIANELHIKPLLRQDGFAVEAEQEGYERHYDAPLAELNPAVHQFQILTIRKWEEHLAQSQHGERGQHPQPSSPSPGGDAAPASSTLG